MECVSHDAAEKTLQGFGRSLKERRFALSIIRTCSYIWFRMVGPTENVPRSTFVSEMATQASQQIMSTILRRATSNRRASPTPIPRHCDLGFPAVAEHAAGSKEEGQI